MSRQVPRLMLSPLSGRVYIVTRYKVIDASRGTFQALEKYDATDQFKELRAKMDVRRGMQVMVPRHFGTDSVYDRGTVTGLAGDVAAVRLDNGREASCPVGLLGMTPEDALHRKATDRREA